MTAPSARHPPATTAASAGVGGTLKTMQVLEYFATETRPVSATEVARANGLNPSTAFNILRTLVQQGYLQHPPSTKRYARGPALYRLAHRLAESPHLPEDARPWLQALASRYDVSVSLWRRASVHGMTLLMLAEGSGAIRLHMTLGVRVPLLQGSMGRIMATEAGLPDKERRRMFEALPLSRPVSYRTFLSQARLARQRGWSFDDGHWHRSVTSMSAPVRTEGRPVEYLCTVAMFRHQHQAAALQALASELRQLAAKIAPLVAPAQAAR